MLIHDLSTSNESTQSHHNSERRSTATIVWPRVKIHSGDRVMPVLLSAQQIYKRFGYLDLLEDVNLTLFSHQVAVIFGPNGVGKTTLIKILATLESSTSGELLYRGKTVKDQLPKFRRAIGLVVHEPLAYPDLTAKENLRFLGEIYGLRDLSIRINYLLAEMGLATNSNQPIRLFSRGMMQKFMIAKALLNNPEILMLDEPFSGLDQVAVNSLLGRIEELKIDGKGILMTTHNVGLGYSAGSTFYSLVNKKVVSLGEKSTHKMEEIAEVYQQQISTANSNSPVHAE